MIPVVYGYARVSKADRDERNLETQLRELEAYGIRQEHIYTDVATGLNLARAGYVTMRSKLRQGDTVVVVWLDRLSRNFTDGTLIQAELANLGIGLVSIREGIDTSDGSPAAQLYRRMMLAQAAYQVESTAERVRVGQDRARADGKEIGRPFSMTPEQVRQAATLLEAGASISSVSRTLGRHRDTIKRAITRAQETPRQAPGGNVEIPCPGPDRPVAGLQRRDRYRGGAGRHADAAAYLHAAADSHALPHTDP